MTKEEKNRAQRINQNQAMIYAKDKDRKAFEADMVKQLDGIRNLRISFVQNKQDQFNEKLEKFTKGINDLVKRSPIHATAQAQLTDCSLAVRKRSNACFSLVLKAINEAASKDDAKLPTDPAQRIRVLKARAAQVKNFLAAIKSFAKQVKLNGRLTVTCNLPRILEMQHALFSLSIERLNRKITKNNTKNATDKLNNDTDQSMLGNLFAEEETSVEMLDDSQDSMFGNLFNEDADVEDIEVQAEQPAQQQEEDISAVKEPLVKYAAPPATPAMQPSPDQDAMQAAERAASKNAMPPATPAMKESSSNVMPSEAPAAAEEAAIQPNQQMRKMVIEDIDPS